MKKKHIARSKARARRSAIGSRSKIALALAGLGVIGVLGGCASNAPESGQRWTEMATRDPSGIPDAVPKVEPKSKYGNMDTYVVRGRRYYTKDSSLGHVERGLASWYGPGFHRRKTSSGEPYDMYSMTAAHKTLPLPTYARVTNLENGHSAVVKINDRGPFHDPRILDLSLAAATKLGVVGKGTALVELRAIDPANPSSDPGPFLAGKSAQPSAPLLADNAPKQNVAVLDDEWLNSVRASDVSSGKLPTPKAVPSEVPTLASRSSSETRERAYRTALAATAAKPASDDSAFGETVSRASAPAPVSTAESSPRVAATAPRIPPRTPSAGDLDAAERAALAKLDEPAVPAAERPSGSSGAAAPVSEGGYASVAGIAPPARAYDIEPSPRLAASSTAVPAKARIADSRERAAPVGLDEPEPKVRATTSRAEPRVASAKDAKTTPKALSAKSARGEVAVAAAKTGKDEPKIASAKQGKDGSKVSAKSSKDAPKLASSKADKDGPKVAAAKAGKDAAKVAAKDSGRNAKDAPKLAAADGQGVYLQVGAFGDRSNAERLRKRLSPHVAGQVRVQNPAAAGAGAGLYKVRVGPFGSEGEARKVSAKLASLGVEQSRRVVN
jgi:rare lipoprotein A